jgi:hypothetical protein
MHILPPAYIEKTKTFMRKRFAQGQISARFSGVDLRRLYQLADDSHRFIMARAVISALLLSQLKQE